MRAVYYSEINSGTISQDIAGLGRIAVAIGLVVRSFVQKKGRKMREWPLGTLFSLKDEQFGSPGLAGLQGQQAKVS